MSQVLPMGVARRAGVPLVHFDRTELSRLLTLYTSRVAEGEWRDYAIDQRSNCAVFAIYRHTLDRPVFTITKLGRPGVDLGWEVANGSGRVHRADTLDGALSVFDRTLRVVTH